MIASNTDKPLKYARVEEERRFLLSSFPADLDIDGPFVRIIDHYIDGTRLRLRRIDTSDGKALVYKLGQKYRSPELKAYQTLMTNIYLHETEYDLFLRLPHSPLDKVRYSYHHDGFDYSLDRFEGHLEGLLLVEIESQGKIKVAHLPVPGFAVRDVTDDPFFTGQNLAGITKAEFQHWLALQ